MALKIIAFILLAVIGLLAVTQIPVLYSIIGERLIELILHTFGQSTSEGSIVARDRYRGYAFNWIASNPIFGQGVGTFKNIYKNNTESNYLELLVSGGIVGLALYYIYLVKEFVKELFRKNKDDFSRIMTYIMISIFIIEIGTVTYLSRIYLFIIVLFFANIQMYSATSDIKKLNIFSRITDRAKKQESDENNNKELKNEE